MHVRKRSYTNTTNFTLRCGVCPIGVIGQKDAVEHAQATGPVNFQEYRWHKSTFFVVLSHLFKKVNEVRS
ncbi:hypothetical protein KSP39_PZI012656 [Platanthera zijinensis]|uniref:OTU1-like C-terminal C2H2-type zinc finger domain-containing protein n=1 Tax=Platanthera zijinensis TaxID=2320716 RepID=A0AAP0BF44_9ASPA